jgi:ABC-type multidrug transport system permease subunit
LKEFVPGVRRLAQQARSRSPSHLFPQLFVLSTGQQRSTRGLVAHQCKYMHKYVARHRAGEYLVPALAGVNLTLTLTLLAALSIVREVERGTWHGLLTTPAGAAAIVLGKLASYLVLGLLLFAALTTLAAALFDTPLGGWEQRTATPSCALRPLDTASSTGYRDAWQ